MEHLITSEELLDDLKSCGSNVYRTVDNVRATILAMADAVSKYKIALLDFWTEQTNAVTNDGLMTEDLHNHSVISNKIDRLVEDFIALEKVVVDLYTK